MPKGWCLTLGCQRPRIDALQLVEVLVARLLLSHPMIFSLTHPNDRGCKAHDMKTELYPHLRGHLRGHLSSLLPQRTGTEYETVSREQRKIGIGAAKE